jgi:hypothetical protein
MAPHDDGISSIMGSHYQLFDFIEFVQPKVNGTHRTATIFQKGTDLAADYSVSVSPNRHSAERPFRMTREERNITQLVSENLPLSRCM